MSTENITITANGKAFTCAPNCPLPQFIEEQGLSIERVVVERNREALTPSEARETILTHGDHLEIVRIVAGG